MNVCRVIINEICIVDFGRKNLRYRIIMPALGKDAVECLVRLDPGRNVQMRRKERIRGAAP